VEKAQIVVTLDTRSEPGRKDATIEVVFAPPSRREFSFTPTASFAATSSCGPAPFSSARSIKASKPVAT